MATNLCPSALKVMGDDNIKVCLSRFLFSMVHNVAVHSSQHHEVERFQELVSLFAFPAL